MDGQQLVKVSKISNDKNVLIQVPCDIVKMWGVSKGDSIEMQICKKTGNVVLVPKKGYIHVKPVE